MVKHVPKWYLGDEGAAGVAAAAAAAAAAATTTISGDRNVPCTVDLEVKTTAHDSDSRPPKIARTRARQVCQSWAGPKDSVVVLVKLFAQQL